MTKPTKINSKKNKSIGAEISNMHVKEQLKTEALINKLGFICGVLDIFFAGLINSYHSVTRWPTTQGTLALFEFIYYSYTNPYAIMCGVLCFILFYQLSKKTYNIQHGSYDNILIISLIITTMWHYITYKGIIVY